MKKIASLALAIYLACPLSAQTIANMKDLTAGQKAAATSIKLTETLSTRGNSDIRQLRDLCWQLKHVDLSTANCPTLPANAFHSRHRLVSVVLPANLKSIDTQAFFACDALKQLTLPATLEEVGTAAFSGCSSLESITIEGTPRLGGFAFRGCNNLRSIKLLSKVPPQCDATAFEGVDMKKCHIEVPAGSEENYRKAAGWKRFFGADNSKKAAVTCVPEEALVPIPAEMSVAKNAEVLAVKRNWIVKAPKSLANEVERANEMLAGRGLNVGKRGAAVLQLAIDASVAEEEGYVLTVNEKGVSITGRTATGVFYGLMTLDQLLRADASSVCCDYLPALTIKDAPRTNVRELMVDPARIFIPFEELKRFVPEMARYKYNALHLHLVDDQAWRIEIKAYPELTGAGSARVGMDDMQVPFSGFYTQAQMKELVAYAAKYHVQIIPEIEMPGHEVAAIHCFPQLTCGAQLVPIRTTCGVSNELLCPGEPFVYEFLGNVFRELAEVFPSPYIHLGGDEAGNPALDCWTNCEKCRALKKELGITTTDRSENWRLQKYLFDRVIDTLRTRYNKTPMFWYETDFKEIQPGCVTFAWRHGLTKTAIEAAIKNKAKIMLCPGEHCYLDYPMRGGDMPEVNWGMPVTSLQQTYKLDPAWGMDEKFEKENLFGVTGTLWSECINSPERLFYQAYPRAQALAEAGWSLQKNRSWEGFMKRLKPTLLDMERRGISHSMAF